MCMENTNTAELAHDTHLNHLMTELAKATRALVNATDNVHYDARDRRTRHGGWTLTHAEALDIVATHHNGPKLAQLFAAAIDAEIDAREAIAIHEANYTGWPRFFHVTNANGHVHSSTGCSTCTPTTEFAFRYDLSGMSEADAVEAIGPVLCSVCYPTAPVEHTNGVSHADAKAKADRDADRAAKAAAKAAKAAAGALFADDPAAYLTVDRTERLKTLRAAKMWLTDAAEWNFSHPAYTPADVAMVLDAVAARNGTTAEVERVEAVKRAAKRR